MEWVCWESTYRILGTLERNLVKVENCRNDKKASAVIE
jgi:hypothetical protein